MPETFAVAHIDILGFKEIIERADTEGRLQQTGEMIDLAFKKVCQIFPSANFKTFSDNVCVSLRIDDDILGDQSISTFILILCAIQMELTIGWGHFVRGAASIGNHYQSDLTIVSKPFVDAYLLESRSAITPRIILDTRITSRLKTAADRMRDNPNIQLVDSMLLYDAKESNPFVNYLSIVPYKYLAGFRGVEAFEKEFVDVLERHKTIIAGAIRWSEKQDITQKMRWCSNYHNWFVSNLQTNTENLLSIFPDKISMQPIKDTISKVVQKLDIQRLLIKEDPINVFHSS